MNQNNRGREYEQKNYKAVLTLAKLLQPVLSVLFYAAIFFIVFFLILTVIIFFVNVEADQLLLAPFMDKIDNGAGEAYIISFGNGIKIITETIELSDIKAVIFAGIFVIICTLLTVAPVFKFLAALMKNIGSGETERILDEKNPRYVMFIGLCIFIGTILIRLMTRFYNYYLAVKFIKCAPQEIKLSLGIDILSGLTGLAILLIGLVFAYIFQHIKNKS